MKKINESGRTDANQNQAGNTSQTGTNVLNRAVLNQPANEPAIRGIVHAEQLDYLRTTFRNLADVDQMIANGDLVVV